MITIDVDEVTKEYLACALWSECDADGGNLMERHKDTSSFSQEAHERARIDVAAFLTNASELIDALVMAAELDEDCISGYGIASDIGHNLWLSRNGHGAGFFDRDHMPECLRDALQDAAEALGSCNVIEGDDTKLHLC